MSLHSDTLTWFRANQSLFVHLNTVSQVHGAWISFPPPPFSLLPPLFQNFHINHTEYTYYSWRLLILSNEEKRMIMKFLKKEWFIWKFEKRGDSTRGEEETKSMPQVPVVLQWNPRLWKIPTLKIALSSPRNSLFIGHASNPPYPY